MPKLTAPRAGRHRPRDRLPRLGLELHRDQGHGDRRAAAPRGGPALHGRWNPSHRVLLLALRPAGAHAHRGAPSPADGLSRRAFQQCLPRDRDAVRAVEYRGAPERDARPLDRLARHLRARRKPAHRRAEDRAARRPRGRPDDPRAERRISRRGFRLAAPDPAGLPVLVARHHLSPQCRPANPPLMFVALQMLAGGIGLLLLRPITARPFASTGRRARSPLSSGSRSRAPASPIPPMPGSPFTRRRSWSAPTDTSAPPSRPCSAGCSSTRRSPWSQIAGMVVILAGIALVTGYWRPLPPRQAAETGAGG